jgi:hypothetical protein
MEAQRGQATSPALTTGYNRRCWEQKCSVVLTGLLLWLLTCADQKFHGDGPSPTAFQPQC